MGNMIRVSLLVGTVAALLTCTVRAGDLSPCRNDGSVFERLSSFNPHLSNRSEAAWSMKFASLSRDEYDFFRGTADLFADELRTRRDDWRDASIPHVQLHGDVHIGNMGTFRGRGALPGAIRFGLVDFDESLVGPFEIDLLRGATALRFAAKEKRLGIGEQDLDDAIEAMCSAYAAALLDPPVGNELAARFRVVRRLLKKARSEESDAYINEFAVGPPLRFRAARTKKDRAVDVMRTVDDDERSRIIDAVWFYLERGTSTATRKRFRFESREELAAGVLDVAAWTRVGSSGSQGLRKYLVLLDRPLRDHAGSLILQLKEEPEPAARRASLLAVGTARGRASEVAAAALQMNPEPPWLVGFTSIGDVEFLVKSKDPWGKEPKSSDISSRRSLIEMATLMGTLVGRGHTLHWTREHSPQLAAQAATSAQARTAMFIEMSACLQVAIEGAFIDLRANPFGAEAP